MGVAQLFSRDDILEDLIYQVAKGKDTAFAELYERTCHMVYWLVLRILREQTAADDTVQEVYVQIWRTAKGFDGARGKVITWILTIARSRALDRLRSGKLFFGQSGSEELDKLTSPQPTPEDCTSASERASLVRRAVALLPPDQRRCIRLAFFQGLTHGEISEQMAIPLGTVKTRTRSGIKRLREELGSIEGFGRSSQRKR